MGQADQEVIRNRDEFFRFLDARGASSYRPATVAGADLSGVDLSGAVLADFRLEGVSLRGATLVDAQLQRIRADRVDLRDAVMDGAELSVAELHGCDLSGARFRRGRFSGRMSRVNLTGMEVSDANLSKASLEYCILNGVSGDRVQGGRLWTCCCTLKDATFRDGRFIKWGLVHSDLSETRFFDTDLRRMSIVRCHLYRTVFERCQGDGMNFEQSELDRVQGLPDGAVVHDSCSVDRPPGAR
jgi:uncharacterized protein YjbI with pentapeptide repeats